MCKECKCPKEKEMIYCGCECHKTFKKYIQPCKEMYHVFTDNYDDYVTTKKEAMKLAKQLFKEYATVRVYHQTEWNEKDGIFEDGDCIYSKGHFPY
jgi:hypothetical protein